MIIKWTRSKIESFYQEVAAEAFDVEPEQLDLSSEATQFILNGLRKIYTWDRWMEPLLRHGYDPKGMMVEDLRACLAEHNAKCRATKAYVH